MLGTIENPQLNRALESLTNEIAMMRGQLEQLNHLPEHPSESGVFSFNTAETCRGGDKQLVKNCAPQLPDARLIHSIIHQRQLRSRFLDGDLFADPAWDILLDLCAAMIEYKQVSITSLCVASGVPATTALRLIGQMVEEGILKRVEDPLDGRRAFIALSDKTANAMARYFAIVGTDTARAI